MPCLSVHDRGRSGACQDDLDIVPSSSPHRRRTISVESSERKLFFPSQKRLGEDIRFKCGGGCFVMLVLFSVFGGRNRLIQFQLFDVIFYLVIQQVFANYFFVFVQQEHIGDGAGVVELVVLDGLVEVPAVQVARVGFGRV